MPVSIHQTRLETHVAAETLAAVTTLGIHAVSDVSVDRMPCSRTRLHEGPMDDGKRLRGKGNAFCARAGSLYPPRLKTPK